MASNDKQIRFFNTTQDNYSGKAARHAQISAVRSHLASRQHASKHTQIGLPVRIQHRVRRSSGEEDSQSAGEQRPQPKVAPLDPSPGVNLQQDGVAAGFDGLEEESLSISQLMSIFNFPPQSVQNLIADDVPLSSGADTDTSSLEIEEANQSFDSSGDNSYNVENSVISIRRLFNRSRDLIPQPARRSGHLLDDGGSGDRKVPHLSRATTVPDGDSSDLDVPRLSRSASAPIASQVFSTLDFVQLPLDITARDKSMIHFYLTFGRRWMLGTSMSPRCCPGIDLAHALLQVCSVYTLAHILLGELILSRATQRALPPNYYSRCAQMYKSVNTLLSDNSATFHRKLWALIQISMFEHVAGRPDIQALHVRAMDDLIESHGGVAAFLSKEQYTDPIRANAHLYAGQLARVETQIPTFSQFEKIVARFINSLRRCQNWALSMQSQSSVSDGFGTSNRIVYRRKLNLLITYLYNLTHKWLATEKESGSSQSDYHESSGAYFCSFSLILSLVEYEASATTTFDFLHYAQECMRESATVSSQYSNELDSLHPAAASHIFSHTRFEIFPKASDVRELLLSQALIDGNKMFMLLSEARKIELVNWSIECVLTIVNPGKDHSMQRTATLFDEERLEGLRRELEAAWRSINGTRQDAGAQQPRKRYSTG